MWIEPSYKWLEVASFLSNFFKAQRFLIYCDEEKQQILLSKKLERTQMLDSFAGEKNA